MVPIIILAAVAAFAASTTIRQGLGWKPVQPHKRTTRERERMRQIRELRKIKEEYLKAQGTEEDEAGTGG